MVRIDGMNDMRRPLYVTRKPNGEYRYQRQLDDKTRELYGKRFYIHSFKTNKLNEVCKAYPTVHAECEDMIARYEQSSHDIPKDIRATLLTELKQRFILLPAPDKATLPDLLDAKAKIKQNLLRLYWRRQDAGEDCEVFDALIKNYAPTKEVIRTYEDLLLRIENAYLRIIGEETIEPAAYGETLAKELAGFNFGYTKTLHKTTENETAPPQRIEAHPAYSSSPKISEALEAWRREGNYEGKTLTDKQYAVKRFIELHGDMRVADIKRAHCRQYRDVLINFPVIKSNKIRQLHLNAIQKLIENGDIDSSNTLANRTINKMLDAIRSIIQIAIHEHDLHINNPCSKLQLKKETKYERLGFEEKELAIFFNSPIYTGCRSIKRRYEAGSQIIRDESFWIPLISLYSGARLEEISQLHISDFDQKDGIPIIHLKEEGGEKRLKTASSVRTVPIHQELILCGLLQYVNEMSAAGNTRLFPCLSRNNYEKRYGKDYGKHFNEYLHVLQLKPDREKTRTIRDFHSFRHQFITVCRDEKIDPSICKRLVGHSKGDVTDGYGEFTVKTLNYWMQKVTHPIDLCHLYIDY